MLSFAKTILINSIYRYLSIRQKPRTLQMPITSRCNSMCKTCNVWKLPEKKDIDAKRLKESLSDSFFSEVETIGLNGGEITLVKNINDILEALFILPKLKSVHIISNGLLPDKLLSLLFKAKQKLNEHGITLGFTLSIDGYNKIHEEVRGISGCFKKSEKILNEITRNQGLYCDTFNIGCTISRFNVAWLPQTECFLEQYPVKVIYHLAVPNKRIHTFNDYTYYVFQEEECRLLALEFFQFKYQTTSLKKDPMTKFRYFANYYFLKNGGKGRLAHCSYLDRDVTINENLELSLCATASESAGNLNEASAQSISKNFRKIRNQNINNCDTCIHYADTPTIKGLLIFIYSLLRKNFDWNHKFIYLTKCPK